MNTKTRKIFRGRTYRKRSIKRKSGYFLRNTIQILTYFDKITATPDGNSYLDKVYAFLLNLQNGQIVKIADVVKPDNLDKFIKCACVFIYERPYYGIQFSNDYSKILRK